MIPGTTCTTAAIGCLSISGLSNCSGVIVAELGTAVLVAVVVALTKDTKYQSKHDTHASKYACTKVHGGTLLLS